MNTFTHFLDFALLTGSKPKRTDTLFPILERAPMGKKIAFLSISPASIRTASITLSPKGVVLSDQDSETLPTGAPMLRHHLLMELGKKTNCGMVIVEVGEFDGIDIAQNVRRPTSQAELIAVTHDPKSILGGSESKNDQRYAILVHPLSTYGYVANLERHKLDAIKSKLTDELKLTVLRMQCSVVSLMSVAMSHPDFTSGKAHLMIADHGNLLFFRAQENGQWIPPRLQQGTLMREESVRRDSIEKITEGAEDIPIIVVDTQTSLSITPEWIPRGIFNAFDPIKSEHLGAYASLADRSEKSGLQVTTSVLRGLAHDIGNVPIEPSELLPPSMKFAAYGFWAAIFAIIAGAAVLQVRKQVNNQTIQSLENERPVIKTEIDSRKIAISNLDRRLETARILDAWLKHNAALQPLVVQLVSPLDSRVQVAQFGITSIPDNPSASHALRIVFSADQRTVNQVTTGFAAAVEKAGWTLRPTNQSVNNGLVTFEAALTNNTNQ